MDYLLHKANGTDTTELNKQVGGFSAISSVLVKLNHNKVGEMELKLSAPAYTIAIGDWVEAKGKRFYCLNNWKEYIPGEFSVTLLTVEGFGLTSNFYHCTESFDTVYSWSRDNNKVDTGSLKTFGEFFCYNVNYQQNTRLFKLGSFPEGMDADYRVLSFTNENALSCLYEICTAYGVRYEFVLNEDEDSLYILNFYAEDVVYPETFSYEKQGGLYELNISNADGQVYTEFVVLGSEDNLPADYPHTELHLPDTYPLSMVKYPNKYATWGRSVKELKLDVKPSRVGIVTSEVAGDLNSFIDSDLISATWTPVGGTIHIVEGPLLGFEFNVSDFNATTGKVTIEQNTENAIILPEAEYYKFTVGTKYTITGIPLPASYLTTAQANLLTESEPHRLYWSDARYDARIRVRPKFLETNGEIEAGMLLPIVHEAINLNRNFRVQSITYDPRREQYYDVTEITISDFRQESIADSQHKAIRTALHRLDNADKVSTSIKTSVRNLDTYIDGAFADGLVSEAEAKAIEKYINIVNSQKSDIDAQFTALYANSYLSGDPKTNLNTAKTALNTATTNLLSSINTAIADGAATTAEKADVDSKFTAFNSAISTYQTRVEEAKGAIEAAIASAASDAVNALDTYIDGAFYDGVISKAEADAIEKYINIVNSKKSDIDAQFTALYANSYLSGTAKTNLNSAKEALNTSVSNLLDSIATAITDGSATAAEKADVDSKFTAFNSALSTYQTRAEQAQEAIHAAAAKAYTDGQLSDYAEVVTGLLGDLQNQIDGNITTWFYAYVPTTANAPANTWTTTALKNQHLGDLFYDTETGYCYRYQLVSSVYSWQRITDSDVTKALADAATAKDVADSKRRVFVAQPVTPYDIGDLWLYGGELYKCKVDTASGSFDWAHWEKGVKYTDDTAANAAAAAAAAAQSAADDAQDDADAANALLANIASDSKLTASEKQAAQKEWDIIQAEKTKNDTQADLYSVSKTAYTNAYNALNSYLSTLLSNLTTTSDITGSEFRGKFKDYYNARTDLLNAISNAAKAAAEATAAALDDAIQVGGRNLYPNTTSEYQEVTFSGWQYYFHYINIGGDASLQIGDNIVWSGYVKAGDNHLGIMLHYEKIGGGYIQRMSNFIAPNEEGKVIGYSTIPEGVSKVCLALRHNSGSAPTATHKYKELKIEKGNKATDWTPAPEDVQAEIDAASDAVNALDTFVNGTFKDGVFTAAEAKSLSTYINTVNSQKSQIDSSYATIYNNSYLTGTAKTNLASEKTLLNTAFTNLLNSITTAIADGNTSAAEKADVDSKFTAFNSALSTYQTRVEEAKGAIEAAIEAAAKAYADTQLGNFATTVTGDISNLQNQIDGNITTWFYAYVPTTANAPASDWTTTALKNQHLGDLFYDTETGYCYRFQLSGETYSWVKITDTDVTKALADAAAAQDTADSKRRVFVTTPTVPYDVGDLWSGGITGDLKRCKTAKATGTYSADDWELASKYTDDSALTTFVSETYTSAISGLQGQIDGKIETYYTDTDPNTWLEADRLKHTGDMWYNTTLKLLKRYNGTSNAWETIEDNKAIEAYNNASNAQDTADSKRRVFVTTPTTPYEVGDLWTGGPEGDLKKCKVERLTGAYNAADWELATKYTDNTAVNQLESDLEYLTEGFKDGSTYVTGGLVLSEFVGVTDGATPTQNVVAGMAGKDFVLDGETPITSPMFFAGSTTAQNANNAKFRVYQDGSMYAELGEIGGLTISASKLYLGTGNHNNADTAFYVDDDGKFSLKNKLSFDGTNLTINGGGTFTGSVSIGDILIGKDAYGSGLHGIKLNAHNYWYLNGANAKFKIGGDTANVYWDGTDLTQNGVKIGGGSMVGTSIDIPNATTPLFKVTSAGVITAKSGTIGGVNFTDTKLYLGTGTYGNSNTGFYVDTSAKFSLKDKLKFDGTNLTINGGGTFSGALSAATGSFAGSLSAATGTFSGSLSAASGTFEGLLDVGGIKIGLNAISAGIDGLYINANNYWDESGNFKAGGSASYVYWNGTTFAIKGDITGSTGTFGGVFAGTIEVGSTLKMGADAGGTGDFGIYIDSANYWLESGFSVGVGGSLLKINDGALEFSGELSSASGTFTGRIEVGDYLKIGANVSGANDGIFINTNNYWYDTGVFKVGSSTKYLHFDGTNATFTGTLSAASGTFSGTVEAGGIKVGLAAGGTGVDGIYIDDYNYWYDNGTFRVGDSVGNKYLSYTSGGLTITGGSITSSTFYAGSSGNSVAVSANAVSSAYAGVYITSAHGTASFGDSGSVLALQLSSSTGLTTITPDAITLNDETTGVAGVSIMDSGAIIITNGSNEVVQISSGKIYLDSMPSASGAFLSVDTAGFVHYGSGSKKIAIGSGSDPNTIYFSTT